MINSQDLRPGTTFKLENAIYRVLDYSHNKQARASAVIYVKLRNIITGATISKTFKSGEKIEPIRIESKPMQYLYHDAGSYHFMDHETYDEIELSKEMVGDDKNFLKDNMELNVQFYDEKPIGLDLPTAVEMKITYTEPGLKGDTVSGATKPATMETGLVVNVPLFINNGQMIKIDTRTGNYLERVK